MNAKALTVAAAQPRCVPKDVKCNALEHAALVLRADARLVVFPELSLTGYELDADPVSPGDPALAPLVAACAETESVALVGAPVVVGAGSVHIARSRSTSTAGAWGWASARTPEWSSTSPIRLA
jgi:predicted amidohydrolase